MRITDLFFLFSVLLVLLGLLGLLVALLAHKWAVFRIAGLGLAVYIILYAILLAGVSLLSPQQVLAMHQLRCFDDWCASVEQVTKQPAIGLVQANGVFYLVTIQVTSRAKRVSQRALDAAAYLLDGSGKRYNLSPQGQQALEAAGLSGQPLSSLVAAGGSFLYTGAFDLPDSASRVSLVFTHGAFPGNMIIGDDQSFLHKPTIVRLSVP